MALPKERIYTTEDIYNLPEGTRAELIDGRIYYMAPPSRQHQDICFSLSRKIADYIDSKHGSCKVYPAPFAVFLNEDDANYFEPDISVICNPSKLDDRGCNGAPDWIIEVVSPSNPMNDYILKLYKYQSAGVREYWIIDSGNQTVTIYDFENQVLAQRFTFSDTISPGIYDDFSIDFSQLNI
ncbi:MAG: Uma2 family endonuclease [Eubacteriales bacterium]|nr:Uma2 family endonuclease [Eubacteriales bacterium]